MAGAAGMAGGVIGVAGMTVVTDERAARPASRRALALPLHSAGAVR